jgi:hypothetical protein
MLKLREKFEGRTRAVKNQAKNDVLKSAADCLQKNDWRRQRASLIESTRCNMRSADQQHDLVKFEMLMIHLGRTIHFDISDRTEVQKHKIPKRQLLFPSQDIEPTMILSPQLLDCLGRFMSSVYRLKVQIAQGNESERDRSGDRHRRGLRTHRRGLRPG